MESQKPQRRSARPNEDLLEVASRYLAKGYSPEKTLEHMAQDGQLEHYGDRLPSSGGTIRYWLKKRWIVLPDPSAPWTIGEGEPRDARLVLGVLPAFHELTGRGAPSVAEARWIVRILRIAPTLRSQPAIACRIALAAWRYTETGDSGSLAWLTDMISFRPWEDGGAAYAAGTNRWLWADLWPAVGERIAALNRAFVAEHGARRDGETHEEYAERVLRAGGTAQAAH